MTAEQITARPFFGIELNGHPFFYGLLQKPVMFLLRAVTPVHIVRTAHFFNSVHPFLQFFVHHNKTLYSVGFSATKLSL
jgi:hypothetical protein